MAIELTRSTLSLEEVLQPKQLGEVELPETVDLGNQPMDSVLSSVEEFNLGLDNARATTLSDLIAKKIRPSGDESTIRISEMLQVMDSTYGFIKFLLKLLGLTPKKK